MDQALIAAGCVQKVALELGLIDRPLLVGALDGPASPLAVRGYLGLLSTLHHDRAIRRLDHYLADCFTEVEQRRVDAAIRAGWIDTYRHALDGVDRFVAVDCREIRYLRGRAATWRYEDDLDLVDGPRMCDVLGLFSWFLHLYCELEPGHLHGWARADARCRARNAWLDARDGGSARAAALDVIRAEEIDPGMFG